LIDKTDIELAGKTGKKRGRPRKKNKKSDLERTKASQAAADLREAKRYGFTLEKKERVLFEKACEILGGGTIAELVIQMSCMVTGEPWGSQRLRDQDLRD
jgi:hypothetical protein